MTITIDPAEATAIAVIDGPDYGVYLRIKIQMAFRDPDPVVRRLQEIIMGRARTLGLLGMTWKTATDEEWGRLCLRVLADDQRLQILG